MLWDSAGELLARLDAHQNHQLSKDHKLCQFSRMINVLKWAGLKKEEMFIGLARST